MKNNETERHAGIQRILDKLERDEAWVADVARQLSDHCEHTDSHQAAFARLREDLGRQWGVC